MRKIIISAIIACSLFLLLGSCATKDSVSYYGEIPWRWWKDSFKPAIEQKDILEESSDNLRGGQLIKAVSDSYLNNTREAAIDSAKNRAKMQIAEILNNRVKTLNTDNEEKAMTLLREIQEGDMLTDKQNESLRRTIEINTQKNSERYFETNAVFSSFRIIATHTDKVDDDHYIGYVLAGIENSSLEKAQEYEHNRQEMTEYAIRLLSMLSTPEVIEVVGILKELSN